MKNKILKNLQKHILNFEDIDGVLDNISISCNYEDGDGQFYNAIRINKDIILVLESYWGNCVETEYYHYSISKNIFKKVSEDIDNKYRQFFEDCDMLDSYNCFFVCGIEPTKDGKAKIVYGKEYFSNIINLNK